jgi:hypothetical protein
VSRKIQLKSSNRYRHIDQSKAKGEGGSFRKLPKDGGVSEGIKRVDAMSLILGIIKSLHLNWNEVPKILPGWRHSV